MATRTLLHTAIEFAPHPSLDLSHRMRATPAGSVDWLYMFTLRKPSNSKIIQPIAAFCCVMAFFAIGSPRPTTCCRPPLRNKRCKKCMRKRTRTLQHRKVHAPRARARLMCETRRAGDSINPSTLPLPFAVASPFVPE